MIVAQNEMATFLPPLSANSLADQVADSIVDAIARQQLKQGQRLVEMDLAASLGVSRVPVREATRILASQGIIVPTHRRGMHVGTFDAAWALQLHNARVAIERLAAKIVAEKLRADPGLVRILEDRVDDIEAEVKRAQHEWFGINRADIAFHAAIFDLAESPLLSTLWSAISRHVLIMFALETYRDSNFERAGAEHRAYIDVLLHGSESEIDREIEVQVAGARIFGADTGVNAVEGGE